MSTPVSNIGGIPVNLNVPGGPGNPIITILNSITAAGAAGNLDAEQPTVTPTVPGGAGSSSATPIILPAPTGTGTTHVLVIDPTQTGFISIPAGWTDVIYNGPGHLVGTVTGAVIGDLIANVSTPTLSATQPQTGPQGTLQVLVNHSVGGTINLAFGRGNVTDAADGTGETVNIGNPVEANTTILGSGTTLNLNDLSGTQPLQSSVTGLLLGSGDYSSIWAQNDTVNVVPFYSQTLFIGGTPTVVGGVSSVAATGNAAGAVINFHAPAGFAGPTAPGAVYNGLLYNVGPSTTINANAGALIIKNYPTGKLTYTGTYSTSGVWNPNTTIVFDAGAGSSFVTGQKFALDNFEATGVDTVTAGPGAHDTIFAYAPVQYDGTQHNNSSVFFAMQPNASSSVNAGTNAVIFGGSTGGGYATIGSGSGSFTFVGVPNTSAHTDNIFQTASSESGYNAVVVANSNEQINLQLAAGAASAPGALMVAYNEAATLNAQFSGGNDSILLLAAQNPATTGSVAITQDATAIGSNAGHDVFFVEMNNTTTQAHTYTIQNFQVSDALVVFNTGNAGLALSATDATTIADYNAQNLSDPNVTASSFTLQDGTTVKFTGTFIPHNVI